MTRGALTAAFLVAPVAAALGAESANYINALHVVSCGGGTMGLDAETGSGEYGLTACIGQPAVGEVRDTVNANKTNVSFFAPVFFGSFYYLDLVGGYNLISLPLTPDRTYFAENFAQSINSQGGQCIAVVAYDNAAGAYQTHPVGTSLNNFVMGVGNGYFVRCAAPSRVKIEGFPFISSTAALSLTSGYNLIGMPLSALPAYSAERAGKEIPGIASQVIGYDAGASAFVTHPVGTSLNNFSLELGKGYFVRCQSGSTWTLTR